jgi:hypothetical protein
VRHRAAQIAPEPVRTLSKTAQKWPQNAQNLPVMRHECAKTQHNAHAPRVE